MLTFLDEDQTSRDYCPFAQSCTSCPSEVTWNSCLSCEALVTWCLFKQQCHYTRISLYSTFCNLFHFIVINVFIIKWSFTWHQLTLRKAFIDQYVDNNNNAFFFICLLGRKCYLLGLECFWNTLWLTLLRRSMMSSKCSNLSVL